MLENKSININDLSDEQKTNYVKNLLFNEEITKALNILLKEETKDIKIIKIILNCLKEEMFINHIKQDSGKKDDELKLYVYSKIINTLAFYDNNEALKAFLKSLDSTKLKSVAAYEYNNKTDVSKANKIFNKYCLKYKKEVIDNSDFDQTEVLNLDENKNNKKNIFIIILIIFIFLIVVTFGYKYYTDSKLLSKYEGVIYPGIYLNDIDLSNTKVIDLKNIIDNEKKRILSGSLVINNVNGSYKYSYKEVGINVNDEDLNKKIISYNENIPRYKKISLIKNKRRYKTFNINGTFDNTVIDGFVKELEKKLNASPRNDGLIVDENHNVSYDKGTNGFILDTNSTSKKIKDALSKLKEETIVEVKGSIIKNEVKYKELSNINTKVSSYTTYFVNAGNRGHNITLASSRLNNTVLMPGETFSYLKVVGPYGASNGYLPAPIYLNGDTATANGGGVCQLASTLYNAQLRAGLETVTRRGHTFAPAYVPKGLDATVYSTTTDYKFKNQYSYPIYIVSYVKGNYLTVDMWTNDAALGGKTYEPYSVASNGGWLAYLKTIENGKVIETKYLDKSVYKAH